MLNNDATPMPPSPGYLLFCTAAYVKWFDEVAPRDEGGKPPTEVSLRLCKALAAGKTVVMHKGRNGKKCALSVQRVDVREILSRDGE